MSTGWVCAQPGLDPKLSSESKQNPKPTQNASWIGRFGSRWVFGFIGRFRFRFLSLILLFWLDLSRFGRYLAGSVEIWPDHNKILPDLIQSDGFQVNFHQIASNIGGFCMFSSKNLRISSKVFGFMIGPGCSGFGRGKPPTDSKVSGFVGGEPPPIVGVSVWVFSVRARAGWSGIRVGWTVLMLTEFRVAKNHRP